VTVSPPPRLAVTLSTTPLVTERPASRRTPARRLDEDFRVVVDVGNRQLQPPLSATSPSGQVTESVIVVAAGAHCGRRRARHDTGRPEGPAGPDGRSRPPDLRPDGRSDPVSGTLTPGSLDAIIPLRTLRATRTGWALIALRTCRWHRSPRIPGRPLAASSPCGPCGPLGPARP
jgi:hypothetical protein